MWGWAYQCTIRSLFYLKKFNVVKFVIHLFFRDLEMHRSPSANSILSNGATGTSSGGFQVSRNAKRLFKSGLGLIAELRQFLEIL